MNNLASKYRPTTFEDFKGSPLVVTMLSRMVETQSLPPCMIFSGPRGVGKTSAARIINRQINAGEASDLSYIEVDSAQNSGVENARKVLEAARYSHPGEWRIIVWDEVHGLSTAAFNALLKDLEDPPEKTTHILVTTQPESIPDTVRSRAMDFRFNMIPKEDILRRVIHVIQKEKLPIRDAKVLTRLSEVAEGSLRNALVLLQQILQVDTPTVEAVNQLSGNTVDTVDLIYSMTSGDLVQFESEMASLFSTSVDVGKFLRSVVETLKEFHRTNIISNKQFLSCMEVVWSMRRIQKGDDQAARTQFEAGLFAMFSQNFWDGTEGKVKTKDESLTTEKLQEMVNA